MAFPTTGILDDFDRADGTASFTGAGWTQQIEGANSGTLTISSNRVGVSANGTGESSSAWHNAATYTDCEVYCTVATKPGSGNPTELYARLQSPGSSAVDGYVLYQWTDAGTDYFEVARIDNGAATVLGATMSQELSAGDSFGMSVIADVIEVWYKPAAGAWTSLGTRTDSTYSAAGYLGLGLWFSTVRVDDFGGGEVVSVTLDEALPDADVTTTGWTTTPLWSKVNDASDATVITATAS